MDEKNQFGESMHLIFKHLFAKIKSPIDSFLAQRLSISTEPEVEEIKDVGLMVK